ncbi:unnamed protein product [Aphis gossypii]|uniref:Uncharacterized protein n=1 Tax=Aphis gossypii TaxID=80765 RepID=A0A9P0J340_APHGO|nr:unnamed protein product [Aphis gossypii]
MILMMVSGLSLIMFNSFQILRNS